MSSAERVAPLHLPLSAANFIQTATRRFLLGLANYELTFEGELPPEPALLVGYPHGEHINSLFLPPTEVGYVGAADHWYKTILSQVLVALIADMVPVTREGATRTQLMEEILWQRDLMQERHKHVMVYPQGSRMGKAGSPAELQAQLKKGIFLMADVLQRSEVYPVGFQYPDDYNPHKGADSAGQRLKNSLLHGHLPDLKQVTVRVGAPIPLPVKRSKFEDTKTLKKMAETLYDLAHGTHPDLNHLTLQKTKKHR